jgi:glutamate carboxypeptidase
MTLSDAARGHVRAIHQTIAAWMPQFEANLGWLVSRDRGYMHKAGVDEGVAWMAARLRELGCEVVTYPSESTGGAVAGTLKGRGQGRYLLLAHLDTVWPEGTAAEWPMRVEGRRAYGPGAVDNTGGSLAGLYALKALQHVGFDGFEALTLLCNGDEESGSVFSGDVIRQVARGKDAAICLEAPSSPDEIVSQRAGSMVYRLEVTGRRAHSQTEPEKGANAILELAHKILEVEKIGAGGGVLKSVVVTAGGGPQSGIVPDYARAEFDVRIEALTDSQVVGEKMRAICGHAWVPGTSATFSSQLYHPPLERVAGSERLVALAQEIGRGELGLELKDTYSGGVTDGSFATAEGTPTLCGVGPFGADYHTRGEWLDLEDVVRRVTLTAGLIAAM